MRALVALHEASGGDELVDVLAGGAALRAYLENRNAFERLKF